MKAMVYLQVAVSLALALQSHAWMNGGDFSKQFEECTGVYNKPSDVNALSVRGYERQCTDLLIPPSHQRIGNFTDDQMGYIKSLIRKSFMEMLNNMGNRVKRTTKSVWRVREEIRSRNGAPFQRYAEAVRRLKKSGEYDVIAQIHITVVPTAHFGPNFLRWHRLYLFILETALGCPIPYWDSSEDYVMKKPQDSVVWTPKYFGNGYGPVVTGPFANFQTPIGPLFRKINADGSLMDRGAVIKYVLSKRRVVDISSPTAKPISNMEGYHNNWHAWINGLMANLAYSAYDPIFFCLHSMIDNVYEIFRRQQVKAGIDPATDFVKTGQKGQSPGDLSQINGFINRYGQSHKLALQVQYQPLSQCPVCHDSKHKYCDSYRGVCVSRAAAPHTNAMEGILIADLMAKKSGLAEGAFGDAFPIFSVDPRTRGDPVQPVQEKKYKY
ncbi:tyrosinase-like protein 1 [Mytilus trossulus]|uniref:tyrosinase-like protein 1 n=1 Tax=Mytilus trossulus TaxID=6551 RepID=UPI003004D9A1